MDIAPERIPRVEPQRREFPRLPVFGLETADRGRQDIYSQREPRNRAHSDSLAHRDKWGEWGSSSECLRRPVYISSYLI